MVTTAKLITAQVQEIKVSPYAEFHERVVFSHERPWPILGSEDFAMPTECCFGEKQMFRIKKFCMDATPSHMASLSLPYNERDIKEWYVAMDPLIQECFESEMNTVKMQAYRDVNEQRRKVAFLESELDRIKGMTAWQTFKVAVSKMFYRS